MSRYLSRVALVESFLVSILMTRRRPLQTAVIANMDSEAVTVTVTPKDIEVSLRDEFF